MVDDIMIDLACNYAVDGISPTDWFCENDHIVIKAVMYRNGRSDDVCDVIARKAKIRLQLVSSQQIGTLLDIRLRYKIVDTYEEFKRLSKEGSSCTTK